MFCDPVWNIVHSIACLGFWENKLRDCLFQNDQYVYGVTGVVGGGGGADKNNFFTKREKKLSSQYIFSLGDVKGCACSNWAWLIQSFIAENETVICKHPVQNCMSTIWFRQEPLLSYCCTKRPQTVWVTSPHKVTVFSALHQGTTIVGMGGDTESVFFLPCIKERLLLAWWAKHGFFLPCIEERLLLAWWAKHGFFSALHRGATIAGMVSKAWFFSALHRGATIAGMVSKAWFFSALHRGATIVGMVSKAWSFSALHRGATIAGMVSDTKSLSFSALHQGVTIVGMVVDTKSLFFSLPCMNYSEGVIMTVGMVGLCLFWEIQLNTGGSACPCFPRVPVLSRWPL